MSDPFEPDYLHQGWGIVDLTLAIRMVCPIHGVSIGRWSSRDTWRIDFMAQATEAQRAEARRVMREFKLQDVHPDDMGEAAVVG